MLIKCINNNIAQVSNKELSNKILFEMELPGGLLPLSINKEYVVYAIEFWNSPFPRFYISDDRYPQMSYPISYYSEFFSIIDNKLPSCWSFGIKKGSEDKIYPIFAFKEWVENPSFFESIISGDKNAKDVFKKYKDLLDAEYA